jgi:hypothetical protein
METYKPDLCLCGHPVGDHKSAGTNWPQEPRYGFCRGCACEEFVRAPEEPTPGCIRWSHWFNPDTGRCNRCLAFEPGFDPALAIRA